MKANLHVLCPKSHLLSYLEKQKPETKDPWIVAVSAGVDSMVLLAAFIELSKLRKDLFPSQIWVAHVNHGWRQEAYKDEILISNYLKKWDTENRFVLKVTKISFDCFQKGENSEAKARAARYDFFEKLSQESRSSWIFLAHHLGDKQETLFKNIFEGKELVYLDGLKSLSRRGALNVARPFLSLEKKDLISFSKRNDVPFEFDTTNDDPKFLRARMRQKFEPVLDEIYPTNWREGLKQLSFYLSEWQEVLDQVISLSSLEPTKGILGFKWNIPKISKDLEKIALRYWLRSLSAQIDPLQREGSQRLMEAILTQSRGFKYQSKLYLWSLYTPCLFALNMSLEPDLKNLKDPRDVWDVFEKEDDLEINKISSWNDFWKGEWSSPRFETGRWLWLDELPQELRKSKRHRYQNSHVPQFLRSLAPIWMDDSLGKIESWSLGEPWPKEAVGSCLWKWKGSFPFH